MTQRSPRRSRVSSRLQTKAKQTAVSLTSVWRWAVAAVLLAAGAAASSWAHTAPRSATSFPRCYEVVGAADPVAAESGMLVYAYGYELHSVRVDGTHDRTLLRADAPVSSPTLSADGRLIAFDEGATTHEIWLMNRDGSGARYVTSGTTPAFSPDGAQLAIGGAPTGSGTAALDVIGVDGTGRRTLAVDAAERPEPAWSPDGTRIVFNKNALAPFDVRKVMIVGADGSNERPFAGGGESAAWSPDGSAVVYSAVFNLDLAKRLWVMSADGTQDHPLGPQGREFDAIAPTWSGDGRKITFVLAPSTNAGDGGTDGLLWQIDKSGRGRHPIAADCRFGSGASDRLHGTKRADRIYGLEGNDTIDVRGGGRDVVDCGPGRDVARADARDVVRSTCELRVGARS